MDSLFNCPACGSAIFWWRKGEWQCAQCHPRPFNPFAVYSVVDKISRDGRLSFKSLELVHREAAAIRERLNKTP